MLCGCFASSDTVKPASCGNQDGFTVVSENPRRKHHAVSEEAGDWTMITSVPQIPLRLGYRRSPGRVCSGHQSPDLRDLTELEDICS